MIVTVTPNPSIDRTILLDTVVIGAVNRAVSTRIDPGGKGVNVSRALTAHGTASTAVLPLGGPDGAVLDNLLAHAGVAVRAVEVAGRTRSNLSLVRSDGTTTKINEPGPALTHSEQSALLTVVKQLLADHPAWLVACGSLPPGLGAEFYADLVHAAAEYGVPVAIDTTRAPLLRAVEAGATLIKPNDAELAQAVGRELPTLGDVVIAADGLRQPGTQVLVSLGARGAVLVDDRGAVHATVRPGTSRTPVSTVGAGDSLLAGFLHAGTRDAEALATGVTWGTAAVGLPGSQMPTPADVAGIRVDLSDPDPELTLTPEPVTIPAPLTTAKDA